LSLLYLRNTNVTRIHINFQGVRHFAILNQNPFYSLIAHNQYYDDQVLDMVLHWDLGMREHLIRFGGPEMAHFIAAPLRSHWLNLIFTYNFSIYSGLGEYTYTIYPTTDNMQFITVTKPYIYNAFPHTEWV